MIHALGRLFEMGGFTMYLLLACSIVSIEIIIERGFFLLRNHINYARLFDEIKESVRGGSIDGAIEKCAKAEKGAEIFQSALREKKKEQIELSIREEKLRREAYLPILATLGVISPFLGLFGTVIGIMRTFFAIASKGSTNPTVVSQGVAEALINTAVGLFVAIVSVTCYNLFKSTIAAHLNNAENLALRLFYLKGGNDGER